MGLALPSKEFFVDRFAGYGKKPYEFHFWIKGEEESNRVLMGNVAIPLDLESLKERLSSLDFLRLRFIGPAVELPESEYRVVFALLDPETGEIGTWSSTFLPPPSKGSKEAAFLNCILGNASLKQSAKKEPFLLNAKDGVLECGQIRFFPKIAGRFSRTEDACVFFQAYYPQESPVDVRFNLSGNNAFSQRIDGEKVAESWNKGSKVWSYAAKLNFENVAPGDYVLKVEIPTLPDRTDLVKEIKLTLL
jgi:hypothetical protein